MPIKGNVKRKYVDAGNTAVPYDAVRQVARVGSFTEIRGGQAIQSR